MDSSSPSIDPASATTTTGLEDPSRQQPQPSPSLTTTTAATLTKSQVFYPRQKTIGKGKDAITFTPQSPAWHVSFSSDGQWLAACYGAPDPHIEIWRRRQQQQQNYDQQKQKQPQPQQKNQQQWIHHSTLDGIHERTIRCVAFSPLPITSATSSSSCVLSAASFDGSVTIWIYEPTTNTWDCTTQLEGHDNEVKYVAWNSTGSLLASCGRDKTVWVWETFLDDTIGGSSDNDFECIAVLNGHDGDVKAITFCPSHGIWGDGDEIIISASYDDTIKVWAEDDGDWYCALSISDIHKDTIWSLAPAPGGGRLISGSADGNLAILKNYTSKERKEQYPDENDSTNGIWKCVGVLDNAHDSCTIYSVDCAPARVGHGRLVSGGGDQRIQVYREVSGSTSDKPLFALDVAVNTDQGDVNCVTWHPTDGSTLCSAGDDGTVIVWKYQV